MIITETKLGECIGVSGYIQLSWKLYSIKSHGYLFGRLFEIEENGI